MTMRPTLRIVPALLVLVGVATLPIAAQTSMAHIEGSVQDLDGDPVPDARVVYRLTDGGGVFIAKPTDATGSYSIEIPAGSSCRPVAVVLADGNRIEVGEAAPVIAADGLDQRITIEVPRTWNPSAVVQNFAGSDRLFLSFVEDTAIVERFRVETQVQRLGSDTIDRGIARVIGMAHFGTLPDVEWGVSVGYAGVEVQGQPGGTGLADTDMWAKYVVGPLKGSTYELAFGAVVTLPTGDDDEGTGLDSTRSRLFAAARREVGWGVLTGNVGLALNGDGHFRGAPLDGQVGLSVAAGAIAPWSYRGALVGELSFETERFEGSEAEATLLGGVNWLVKEGALRAAVGLGLTDGAADFQITAGYALHF